MMSKHVALFPQKCVIKVLHLHLSNSALIYDMIIHLVEDRYIGGRRQAVYLHRRSTLVGSSCDI